MKAASLRAQAKINLRLRIIARESSGYHQIETLFCRLDLADEVRVELTPASRSLECAGPAMPADGLGAMRDNLAFRAASQYLEAAGDSRGFRIDIGKHIPVGGGLGGGSADAGAVLRLLDHLCGAVSADVVTTIAASLGADVPFLTQAASTLAVGWGRGDRLLPLPPLPSRACRLVVAPFGINTGSAYGWIAAESLRPGATPLDPDSLSSWPEVASLAVNQFEEVVLPRHPSLRDALEGLARSQDGPAIVRMSGSGATLFAIPVAGDAPPSRRPVLPPGFRVLESSTASRVDGVVAG